MALEIAGLASGLQPLSILFFDKIGFYENLKWKVKFFTPNRAIKTSSNGA
jgi:hypothetical protein